MTCTHDIVDRDIAVSADGYCPLCQRAEIERLRLSVQQWEADALRYCQNASNARNLAIEECARVAESFPGFEINGRQIATAIRALKEKQP